MKRRRELLFQLIWWAAVAGVGWLTLRYALVWLLPFLLALGAASLLEPLIEAARRRLHLRRGFTAAVLTLVLVGGLLAVLIVLAVQVVEQAVSLVSSLPALLAALPDTLASLERRLESFCAACPEGVGRTAQGLLMGLPEAVSRLAGQFSTAVLQGAARIMGALPRVLLACGTTVLAVFFTLSAYPEVMAFFRRQLGSELDRARGVKASVFATLGKWLKAECILLAVTFCQLLVGLLLIRQEYALLLAALIALIDALPVFGTGTVLAPWAAVECLLGNVPKGAALLALFAVISFLFANLGLSSIITFSVPVLMFLYPLSITLILLALWRRWRPCMWASARRAWRGWCSRRCFCCWSSSCGMGAISGCGGSCHREKKVL